MIKGVSFLNSGSHCISRKTAQRLVLRRITEVEKCVSRGTPGGRFGHLLCSSQYRGHEGRFNIWIELPCRVEVWGINLQSYCINRRGHEQRAALRHWDTFFLRGPGMHSLAWRGVASNPIIVLHSFVSQSYHEYHPKYSQPSEKHNLTFCHCL